MKLKLSLKTKLLVSLLMISIVAIQVTAQEKTIAVAKGEKAPFEGLLMPEYQFRKMNQDLIEKDLLKQQATATVLEDHPNPVKVFLLGVLTGVSTVLLVEKFGGK